jgi:addiction module RelE/StbE family toxin
VKLAWTQEALEKLVEIEEYISKDSPARAEKFINQLIGRAESLSKNPNKGRIVPEFLIPELRELIFKNYRIVYLLRKYSIEIITVFESHRLIRKSEIFKK